MTETMCDKCGVLFEQTGKRRFSTCSTCRYASRRTVQDKLCVKCGSAFKPKKRKQEACSTACGGPKWRAPKSCTQCGADFKPADSQAQFCSHQCRADASKTDTGALGYRLLTVNPGHPLLAFGQHRIFEHRAVLWEKYGPGSHPCHYCGQSLDWLPGQMTRDGKITTEHLDGDRGNNDPTNLVVACHGCNVRAGQARRVAATV